MLLKVVVHSTALFLAALVTWHGFRPIQQAAFGDSAPVATLVFLPFGVKIISAYFEGWRSVPYLMPGAILANEAFWQLPLTEDFAVFAILASYSVAPACFAAADWLTGRDRLEVDHHASWRLIIICGMGASVAGAVLINLILSHAEVLVGDLPSMASFALGDFMGLLAVLTAITLFVRWRRAQGAGGF